MKKFKHILEWADYMKDKYPIDMKQVDVSPVDRKDITDLTKDAGFQNIQSEMQKRLKRKLKKHNPNVDDKDAEQASDRFIDGNSIGPEKKQRIKQIVDNPKLDDKQKAKKIIKQGKKEVINNYYRSDKGDVEFTPE